MSVNPIDPAISPCRMPDKTYTITVPALPAGELSGIRLCIDRLIVRSRVHHWSAVDNHDGTVNLAVTFSLHPHGYLRGFLNSGNFRTLLTVIRKFGGQAREVPNLGRSAEENARGREDAPIHEDD